MNIMVKGSLLSFHSELVSESNKRKPRNEFGVTVKPWDRVSSLKKIVKKRRAESPPFSKEQPFSKQQTDYCVQPELLNTGTARFTPVSGSVWMQLIDAALGFTVTVIFAVYLLFAGNVGRATAVPPVRDIELLVNVAIFDVVGAMVPRFWPLITTPPSLLKISSSTVAVRVVLKLLIRQYVGTTEAFTNHQEAPDRRSYPKCLWRQTPLLHRFVHLHQ